MMEFYVSGQSLKFFTPVIAADALNYLTAKVNFSDEQWDGYSKWLHFRQDEGLGAVTYDLQLNDDNEITEEQRLNLTIGQWEIYLTGTREESRLTTVPVILTVKESGLIDAPLHELPMSVAEQVDYNASQALLLARTVRDMAEAGEFDGQDGTSLAPIGHFGTVDELAAIIKDPSPGDVYSVGEKLPYDLYAWDGINLMWRNHGQPQGPPGEDGASGATFIPSVDVNGNISWVNDKGLVNPATRNIMGPAGNDGATGPAGPGAFEKAQEAGYTGTEETFYAALTMMPYHNKRHLPEGADPITMQTGNYADGSVTRAKLAQDALYSPTNLFSTANYSIAADDLGKTIMSSNTAANADITISLSQAVSSAMPVGAEIALLWLYGKSFTLLADGVRLAAVGSATFANEKICIAERFGMMALKKCAPDSTNGDLWVVQGLVEVVS